MTTFLKIGGFVGLALVGMGGTAALSPEYTPEANNEKPRYTASANCMIKGNISYKSGEKIYHLPGQEYYSVTAIRPYYGERWFCSEKDAQRAGWRRARQ